MKSQKPSNLFWVVFLYSVMLSKIGYKTEYINENSTLNNQK